MQQFDQPINTGSQQNTYDEFTFTLVAGEHMRFDHAFDYVAFLENDSVDVKYSFNGKSSNSDVSVGIGLRLPSIIPFIELRNTGLTTAVIKIALAVGDIRDNRSVNTGTVAVKGGDVFGGLSPVNVVAGTPKLILVGDNTRTGFTIFNNGGGVVWIGGSDISDVLKNGIPVSSGQSYTDNHGGAVYGDSEIGTNQITIVHTKTN